LYSADSKYAKTMASGVGDHGEDVYSEKEKIAGRGAVQAKKPEIGRAPLMQKYGE